MAEMAELFLQFNFLRLEKGGYTKSDEFSEKFQRREGDIFNPKIYVADIGNFKQSFLSMRLIQKSIFWVRGMFSNNCIEKNQNTR